MRLYIVTEFYMGTSINRAVCSTRMIAEKIGKKLATRTNHIDIEMPTPRSGSPGRGSK